jgi:hypothetical protein
MSRGPARTSHEKKPKSVKEAKEWQEKKRRGGEMKLLPCPFCGNAPRVSRVPIIPFGGKEATGYSVSCAGPCLMKLVTTGTYQGTEDRAADAWNTREEGK